MTLFEITFALSAIVLGLALTHVAASLHKLLLAGRRVRWALEPILLTLMVLLVIVSVWIGQWFYRNETSATIGWLIFQVAKLLILYIAAASCLPEPETADARVDMLAYYDRTRALSFGALIISYALFEVSRVLARGWPKDITLDILQSWFLYPAIYASLILIRARWYNIAALLFALLHYATEIMMVRVGVEA